jgi:hypothetical protein
MTPVTPTVRAFNFWQPLPAQASVFEQYWRLAVLAGLMMFLVMQVTGGIIRWLLPPAAYLPTLLMLGCVASLLLVELITQRIHIGVFFLLALLGFAFLIGVLSTPRIVQPIFALWVFVPVYFGMVAAPLAFQSHRYKSPILLGLAILCAGGVVVHNSVAYPWVGLSYEVAGVEVAGAREWVAAGKQRLSGLARSSFDVAGQILIFVSLVAVSTRLLIWRLLLWGLGAYAISLSTSKGVFLSLLMVVVTVELLRYRGTLGMWGVRGVIGLGYVWLLVPPILGWSKDWTELARTDIHHPLYGSFIDRMHDMWPRALALITEHGYFIFGRGLGGLGVPVGMFEPKLANAGDNLFVYLLVIFGVLAIPLMLLGLVVLLRMCSYLHHPAIQQTLLLAVAVIWYGGVSNILEHAVMALAFGMICRTIASFLAGAFEPPADPIETHVHPVISDPALPHAPIQQAASPLTLTDSDRH